MTKVRAYIQETIHELLHKVTWPTWRELINSSILVVVASVILALSIFVMDYVVGAKDTDGWGGLLKMYYGFFS